MYPCAVLLKVSEYPPRPASLALRSLRPPGSSFSDHHHHNSIHPSVNINAQDLHPPYIARMTSSKIQNVNFWQAYVNGFEPCTIDLACGNPSSGDNRHLTKIPRGGGLDRVREFCDATGKSPSNVLKAAWAMVLRFYSTTEIGIFEFVEGSLVTAQGTKSARACPTYLSSLVRFQLENDMNCGDIVSYMSKDRSRISLSGLPASVQLQEPSLTATCRYTTPDWLCGKLLTSACPLAALDFWTPLRAR